MNRKARKEHKGSSIFSSLRSLRSLRFNRRSALSCAPGNFRCANWGNEITFGAVVVVANPAVKAFVAQVGNELVLAQALIRRVGAGFELRHVDDRNRVDETLRSLTIAHLRTVAQFTTTGVFRPLKSSPNLQAGWRIVLSDERKLELALNQLYPGAIADWHAAQSPKPPVTHYREFTRRQTGMYRITTMLDDAQAVRVIGAGCHKRFCLKQRLWTVEGIPPDAATEKSLIPCLEPCALLLEFARKAMRIEQQSKIEIAPDEAATIVYALQTALVHPDPGAREGDFNALDNPRRIQLVLEKLRSALKRAGAPEAE